MSEKNIYLICPVRQCDDDTYLELVNYVDSLEQQNYTVHFPPRDVDQKLSASEICKLHSFAMTKCNEVHIWWDDSSRGSLFDFGMAYALGKPIKIINEVTFDGKKSYKSLAIQMTLEYINNNG